MNVDSNGDYIDDDVSSNDDANSNDDDFDSDASDGDMALMSMSNPANGCCSTPGREKEMGGVSQTFNGRGGPLIR